MRPVVGVVFALGIGWARADVAIVEGNHPVFSPDGRRLAFQRETAEGTRLGVYDRAAKTVTWIDGMPGHAAQAAWHPTDGSLVYVYGHETRTAMEGLRASEQTGWNLRLWRNGEVSFLTSGRFRDYTPSFSVNGRDVYFASTRIPVGPGRTSGTILCRVSATGGPVENLTEAVGNSSGLASPQVSPDGRRLVWAALDSAFGAWHLAAARCDSPKRSCRITASDLVAYAPRWSPDGRWIACTAFRAGDLGWSVYLVDPRTGSDRRLCEGREPAFAPDGRHLAFVRNDTIFERALSVRDYPAAAAEAENSEDLSPTCILTISAPTTGDCIPLPPSAAFDADRPFYLRLKGRVPKTDTASGAQCAFAGRYAEHDLGFQIVYHNGGLCTFALRTSTGEYVGFPSNRRVKSGADVEIICVRQGGSAAISINGSEPLVKNLSSTLPLLTPRYVEICPPYHGEPSAWEIDEIEIGTGWPTRMKRPATREEVFR